MTRLHRLHRSALISFTVCIVALVLSAPGAAEFIAGRPFFLIVMLIAATVFASAGALFLAVADKVDTRHQAVDGAALIEDALAA